MLLLDKLDTAADRLWFTAKAIEHGWSRNVLALQIGSGLYRRQRKAVTNFKSTLPPAQSDGASDSRRSGESQIPPTAGLRVR